MEGATGSAMQRTIAGVTLAIRQVDITTLAVDAIVNAANADLTPGGGVCGAIHRAAGPELASDCFLLGRCPTGDARITPGFRLPAKWVIHAVGPVWRGGTGGEEVLLRSAYVRALELAQQHGAASIAFPAISTGIYGYPHSPAASIAVNAVVDTLPRVPGIRQVVFACFGAETERALAGALALVKG
jgi:O-acetyl-ADP-ribose deacetylase (regulator of RNase III)